MRAGSMKEKAIDDAIAMLRRMRDDSSEPTKSFEVSATTAKEVKEVADGFMAVVTALVAVTMEDVLDSVLEFEAADRLHERLSTFLWRMTAMDDARKLMDPWIIIGEPLHSVRSKLVLRACYCPQHPKFF